MPFVLLGLWSCAPVLASPACGAGGGARDYRLRLGFASPPVTTGGPVDDPAGVGMFQPSHPRGVPVAALGREDEFAVARRLNGTPAHTRHRLQVYLRAWRPGPIPRFCSIAASPQYFICCEAVNAG